MITPEKAQTMLDQAIQEQKKYYAVIVDGNTHPLAARIVTTKEQITLQKCQSLVKKIQEKFDITVRKIEIDMDVYDYSVVKDGAEYLNVLYGDAGLPTLQEKKAIYDVKNNCLQIWSYGLPIYENNNGVICRDQDALADCLM